MGNHHPPATTTYACHPFAICHCPLPPHPIYSSVCENAIKSLKLQLQLLLHLQLKSPATPKEKAVATKSVNWQWNRNAMVWGSVDPLQVTLWVSRTYNPRPSKWVCFRLTIWPFGQALPSATYWGFGAVPWGRMRNANYLHDLGHLGKKFWRPTEPSILAKTLGQLNWNAK